ncbi:beta-1,3-galactosyltransferase 1-like [Tubulanus polymorphus]|uniref:beta-1,3-galactosyltransferase 1-like n=1 Tax=Tubulanus polymorphus TaxID=672921 RepID=UPI003DA3ABCB
MVSKILVRLLKATVTTIVIIQTLFLIYIAAGALFGTRSIISSDRHANTTVLKTGAGARPVSKIAERRKSAVASIPVRKRKVRYVLKKQKNYGEYFKKRDQIVNSYLSEVKWILNPGCKSPEAPHLLVLVTSRVGDKLTRDRLRITWGTSSFTGEWTHGRKLPRYAISIYYLVGKPPPDGGESETNLQGEFKDFADLIVADFDDVYGNLTLKTALALRWATEHCPDAAYVMKADSDIFVNVPKLLEDVNAANLGLENKIMGYVNGPRPLVIRGGRYGVPVGQYPFEVYPPYLAGNAYVMHARTASRLYRAALRTRLINMEDVYFTGILATIEGVRLFHNRRFANNVIHRRRSSEQIACWIKRNTSVIVTNVDRWQMREIWERLEMTPNPCS